MKPGYPGFEKIKPNPPNRKNPGFKPGSGKLGLFEIPNVWARGPISFHEFNLHFT